MQTEILISGFGGQGALFAGQLLAHAALDAGLETTWFPSYGPEMRGGTAHCTVIVADRPIGSPVVRNPRAAIVMNIPSLERYEPVVASGGVLVVNASLVDRAPRRIDVDALMIPAGELAQELGDPRMANMVLLGALLTRIVMPDLAQVKATLRRVLPERRRAMLEPNLSALDRGALAAGTPLPPAGAGRNAHPA